MPTTPRADVYTAIDRERAYQTRKWGSIQRHPHELAGYTTLMQVKLRKVEDAWAGARDDSAALRELLKVVALGVACLEQHGIIEREARPADG